jgi:3-dehydroquinate dehydratase-2
VKGRIEILHGVNLDVLGRRPATHYGGLTLDQLQVHITNHAAELGLTVTFFQSNHEGAFCEELHNTNAAGLILNPGAWTHYSWAIRDALEVAALPAVEVHLSAVDEREEWRRVSVIRDVCIGSVQGEGPDGYRDALLLLAEHLRK